LNDEVASVQNIRRLQTSSDLIQNLRNGNQNRRRSSFTEDPIPMTCKKREQASLLKNKPGRLILTLLHITKGEMRPAYPHLQAL
jgi:hypothetical protein